MNAVLIIATTYTWTKVLRIALPWSIFILLFLPLRTIFAPGGAMEAESIAKYQKYYFRLLR